MSINIKYFIFICLIPGLLKAQKKKWILGIGMKNVSPSTSILKFWEADLSNGNAIFTPRSIGNSINNIVSVGVNETINNYCDANGKIIFYAFVNASTYNSGSGETLYFVAHDSITGKDEVFASITAGMSTFDCSVKNMNIVEKPGYAGQYYVVYKTTGTNLYEGSLNYTTVNMNTKAVNPPTVLLSGSINEAQAISAYNCYLDNRWLFFTKQSGTTIQLYRCSITSSDISLPTLVSSVTQNGTTVSLGQGEMEISPSGNTLAYANFVDATVVEDILLWSLNLVDGGISNQRYINNPTDFILQIAFSPDGQRLYASRSGSLSYVNELYNVPVPASGNYTIQSSDKLNLQINLCFGIESGYNGYLYFTDNLVNTQLRYITNPNASAPSNIILQTITNSFGMGDGVSSSFPDQIFGEGEPVGDLYIQSTAVTPCSSHSTTLTASGGTNYQWSGGSTATTPVIIVSPTVTTTYIVSSGNGPCANTDSVIIEVNSNIDRQIIPNIFTPNSDGINDSFTFTGLDPCSEYNLTIYNRWGQKVFETDAPQTISWNGTINGKNASDDTYFYILTQKSSNKFAVKGHVTLIR